ncbi:MAG: NAD(+)/NADH kinase [Lachnospiraceae bacterium]|nr:NAD(+)/NADH kinase [Lachnospiraceae bacterium]
MKKYLILVNDEKDKGFQLTRSISAYLSDRGAECSYMKISRNESLCLMDGKESPDCVITLGGDGTFVQAASHKELISVPMLGINLGNMGYLAEVEKDHIFPSLDRLLKGDYKIESRMMLKGAYFSGMNDGTSGHGSGKENMPEIEGKDDSLKKEEKNRLALNDIVITRYGSLRAVRYELYVNGRLLNTYDADGIIISTPTGSTGYSLSAGGPIVEPTARLILINPICPHTLNTRAIVLDSGDSVRVKVAGRGFSPEHEALVCFDGGSTELLKPFDEVEVTCADVEAKLIKLREESFLDILSKKMRDK